MTTPKSELRDGKLDNNKDDSALFSAILSFNEQSSQAKNLAGSPDAGLGATGRCSNREDVYSKTDTGIAASEEYQALSDESIYSQIYSAGCLK